MFEFFKVDLSPVEGEETILPEQKLSEEEQKMLYRVIARLMNGSDSESRPRYYGKENAVAIWSQEHAFNYHDDSWDEYDILIAEKITEEEFREGITHPEQNLSAGLQKIWTLHHHPVEFIELSHAILTEEKSSPYNWQRHPFEYFKGLEGECEACYIWESSFPGKLRSWCAAYERAYWDSYAVAYVTGLHELPGYFRIVHAVGNDRE